MNIYVSVQNNKVANYQIGAGSVNESLLIPEQYGLDDLPFLTITENVEIVQVLSEVTQLLEPVEIRTIDISFDEAAKNAEILVQQNEIAMRQLRIKRDELLKESDFSQLADAPISTQKKAEFVIYRQALRDLPQNVVDIMNPVFPNKPE